MTFCSTIRPLGESCQGPKIIFATATSADACNSRISARVVSSGNDATHFVGCSGLVALHDCRFQGMLDDATNVHGHYARIQEQPEPNQVLVRHMHGQQRGFQLAAPGEQVAWVDPATFAHRQILTVTAFTRVDAEQALITFDAPWDTGTPDGLIENLSRQPDLTVSGCHFSGNRARGMLVATRGSVRITNNHIAAPGVQAHSVSELSISGNRLEPVPGLADAMNSRSQGPFNIRDCGEVELSDNALI